MKSWETVWLIGWPKAFVHPDGSWAAPFWVSMSDVLQLPCPSLPLLLLHLGIGLGFFPLHVPFIFLPAVWAHCRADSSWRTTARRVGFLGLGNKRREITLREALVNKGYGNQTQTMLVALFWMLLFSKRGNWGNAVRFSFPLTCLFNTAIYREMW